MNKYPKLGRSAGCLPVRAGWKTALQLFLLSLAAGLATPALTHAGQANKDKLDLEAEAKQAAKEDAEQMAERLQGVKGKYQRKFFGTFLAITDPSQNSAQNLSPEVVGLLVTGAADKKPGRKYQVKVADGREEVIEMLKRVDRKNTEMTGKLRNIGPDGEAKYLIVTSVIEAAATPRIVERRRPGGI